MIPHALSLAQEYGSLKIDQARRMKGLEKEKLQLRRPIVGPRNCDVAIGGFRFRHASPPGVYGEASNNALTAR